MTPAEILTAARALLTPRERWTQFALARDLHDEQVSVQSPQAACFCMIGAIGRVSQNHPNYGGIAADYLRAATGRSSIAYANDDPATTHADVLRWIDAAIARTREAERG